MVSGNCGSPGPFIQDKLAIIAAPLASIVRQRKAAKKENQGQTGRVQSSEGASSNTKT